MKVAGNRKFSYYIEEALKEKMGEEIEEVSLLEESEITKKKK